MNRRYRSCALVVAWLGHLATSQRGLAATRLLLPEGGPAAGAEVTAWACSASTLRLLEGPRLRGRTDRSGVLDAELPEEGCLLLAIDAPGAPPQVVQLRDNVPVSLKLAAGVLLHARVSLPSSAPPAERNARLCVSGDLVLQPIERKVPWERCATAAPDGAVVLPGIPSGSVRFALAVPGFLVTRGERDTRQKWELRPLAGVPFFGRVVDAGAQPVAGAVLRSRDAIDATTGPDGSFRMTIHAPPADVEVSAFGYAPLAHRTRASPPGEAALLRLDRGAWIDAAVVADPSEPLPRGTITLERKTARAGWRARDVPLDRASGLVRIPVAEPGTYRLRVRAEGYRATWVEPFEVPAGATVRLGTLSLDRGLVVRGRCVREDRSPVSGARVRIEPRGAALLGDLEVGFRTVTTHADGRFEIAGLSSGRYDLRVRHRRAGSSERRIELDGRAAEDLGDVVLDAETRVAGRVMDRSGTARSDLTVKQYDEEGARLVPLDQWTTDAAGRFVANVPPGKYLLRVESDHVLLSQSVEIEAVEKQQLELTVPGVAVHGLVARDGEPVAEGTVLLVEPTDPGLRGGVIDLRGSGEQRVLGGPTSRQSAPVDVNGRFDFGDVAPGLDRFAYVAGDGRKWTRDLLVPDQADASVLVDLTGLVLRGRVHERGADTPVAGATLRLVADLGDVMAGGQSADDGRFAIADLQPGRYRLTVSAPGYVTKTVADVPVEPGAPELDCELDHGAGGDLRAHLTRPDGSPAAFDFLTLVDASGAKVRAAPTDEMGRVVFEDLPAGVFFVVWGDALAGAGVSRPVVLSAEQDGADLEQVLPPGSDVVLSCVTCAGKPAGSLFVVSGGILLNGALPGLAGARVFPADGMLSLGRVSAGSAYTLSWSDGSRTLRTTFPADGTRVTVALR